VRPGGHLCENLPFLTDWRGGVALRSLGSRNWVRAASAAAVVLWALAAPALDPTRALTQYNLRKWDSDTGLPQGSIQALFQSRDGYLLLGTQEGLIRFNGELFSALPISPRHPALAPDVRCLLEERDGTLWIGTYGGGLFRKGPGGIQIFTTADRLAGDTVLCLAQDSSGAVWAGTETGLSRIAGGAGITTLRQADGLPSDDVEALFADVGGALWIGTARGLCRYEKGVLTPVALGPFGEAGILGLYRDRQRRLWIAGRSGAAVLGPEPGAEARPVGGLPRGDVWCFLEDRDGSFWIGTSGGLCRLRGDRVETLGPGEGLSYPAVRALVEDNEGSLWVGTTSGGLNQLWDGSFSTLTSREGLPADFVWCVTEDPRGGLWIGTDLGGLCHLRGGVLRAYGEADGVDATQISSLCADVEGRVWAGSRDALFVGREGGPFRRFDSRDGLPEGRVRAILAPRAGGGVWVASHGGGLSFFDGKRFKTYTTADGLPGNFIRCLLETRDGSLWIGTHQSGLCRYRDGRFERPPGAEAFRTSLTMGLMEDSEGAVWVADNGQGLLLFREGRWSRFTTADGLIDEKPFRVLEDDLGFIWVTCNRGIVRLSRAALLARAAGGAADPRPELFGLSDGLRTSECNGGFQPAGCRSRDGRLWIPTPKGLAVVEPRRLRRNPHIPPVLLEQFLVRGKIVPEGEPVLLKAGARDLEFHYTALSYQSPERVRFQYRMEGYDPGWVDAGNRRTAYYTTLPPGSYTFRVRGCNSDGVWNERGASLSFGIEPRLDQRWPFRAAVGLALAALLYALFRFRVRSLSVRGAQLEQAVAERTTALKCANEALERLAATDGLTGLPNHRTFHEHLAQEGARAARSGAPLAVIVADIDHFKTFNDTRGHLEGDRALRRVAEALAGALHRPADFVARYGGEEFAFVLPETPREGAVHVAEVLRVAVEALGEPHPTSGVAPVVTVSLGVAAGFVTGQCRADALLARADAALYRAKAGGRNRVEMD